MAGPRYPLYERNAGTLKMVAEIQALILKGAPVHLHHMAGHCQEASGNLLRPHAFVKVTRCLMGKSHLFHQGYHTKSSETDGHPSEKPWGLRDTVNVTLFWRGGLEASVFLFNGFSQFVLGVSFFFEFDRNGDKGYWKIRPSEKVTVDHIRWPSSLDDCVSGAAHMAGGRTKQ